MDRKEELYEYVMTDGPGTMIDLGVIVGLAPFRQCLVDVVTVAAFNNVSVQAEPCDDDCETGK